MAAKRKPLSRIRLVYRRSSTLLKCVVLTAIVLSTVCLMALRAILEVQEKTDDLRTQAAELEQRNKRLEQYIGGIGTVEGIKNVAFDKLGLVDPDTVIFLPEEE